MKHKLNTKRSGFTLVEIMIVVSIISLLAAIAVPNFMRSRKRSQATQILDELRMISSAVDQYALETNRIANFQVSWPDVQKYLKKSTRLFASRGNDIFGGPYGSKDTTGTSSYAGVFVVDGAITFDNVTFDRLQDIAPADFWSPFTAN